MSSPRNIILLSDGTGNSRGKAERTNVWRTYEAIDVRDPPEPQTPRQFAFYDDGVGTSSFKPLALAGGALGVGLARNVRDLYQFLCRTWRPGDRIYAFGFSRGAFTIRVLIGLISHQGLMPYRGDEDELRRLTLDAFRAYRRARYKLPLNWIELPRAMRDRASDLWARWRGYRRHADVVGRQMVDIHFVGLWDTVAAYGMPVDEIATFINKVVWPMEMPDTVLSSRVRCAVHALAIDDERQTFHPKLWTSDERITQVWFAGMHADVGGGYPDQGLAHVSLNWMLEQAAAAGLRLSPDVRALQQSLADENGPMNDSRSGIGGYYRYQPRALPAGAIVHRSVIRRIQVGQDGYAPLVLPPDFQVMDLDGSVRSGMDVLPDLDPAAYDQGREHALNRAWMRRVLYFLTVLITLVALALPLQEDQNGGACTDTLCWLSPTLRGLQTVLPSAAEPWTSWYAAHPAVAGLLIPLLSFLLWAGTTAQIRVFDRMRAVWYSIPSMCPSSLSARGQHPSPRRGTAFGAVLITLRNAPPYRAAVRGLRHVMFPLLWGLALTAGTGALLTSTVFAVRSANGAFCAEQAEPDSVNPRQFGPVSGQFDITDLCAPTRAWLEAGATYEIRLTTLPMPAGARHACATLLCDNALEADWQGVKSRPPHHLLAWPLKRELAPPFFAPLARVGARGADVYVLHAVPAQARVDLARSMTTRIVARTSGPLYLYLNDAVGPPGASDFFYRNNSGHVAFRVHAVKPSPPAGAPVDGPAETATTEDGSPQGGPTTGRPAALGYPSPAQPGLTTPGWSGGKPT